MQRSKEPPRRRAISLLYIGTRWYDAVVGRWTSADKWLGNIYLPLSLNRYPWGVDDPVHAVDPSGYLPKWKDIQHWLKEHSRTIVRGAQTVPGVITGIKVAEEIYVDWDTSNRMSDMFRIGQPRDPDNVK